LPFKYSGSNPDLKALAEGLSEEIVTGLSRFSYLRVIARGSTAKYSSESGDVRAIGKELGARYVVEGSVRQAGTRVRVMAQLSDAIGGVQLWAETYERPFDSEAVFSLQDDLVPRIVSTVADSYGVLPHTMSLAVRRKDPTLLTPYEALLRSFSYAERVTAEEHIAAKDALKRAVGQSPNSSDCWAMLSILQTDGNIHGLDPAPDSLDDALQSAQRAVDIAPTNHKAYQALAWVRYFRKEFPASRKAAERTIALNPMDGAALVYVGQTIAFTGDWERGCSLILHATELNPNHAGWYWYTPFLNAYRKNDYSGALDYALKINMPGFPLACIALAVAYGQLGQGGEAQRALRELLTLRPDYASLARSELRKIWDDQLVEHLIDGLRKAGLDIVDDSTKPPPASSVATATRTGSSAAHASVREDEGFWVAVLPFRYSGDSADLKALAEGLSEEVITGLSRFSYLRVIARGSTAKYLSESGDVRAIGKELGARYVMEGSLRQAGSAIRLAVRLVDATTCTHLWAETFEHPFHPNQIFALQDQLVPRIVSTVADAHGILTRSISAAIRKKSDDQLSPYEAVFRVFSLHEQITANDHATCRDLLERTVKDTPDAADCWAMLATLYGDEDWLGLNPRPGSLVREAAAAQRAVELAPAGALANHALAQSLFQRHEWQAFKPVAERTIALNPLGGASMAFLGALLACTGEWEKGCAVADSAMKLQPNFAGYYWLARVLNAYRTRDYRTAIDTALRIQMPGFFWAPVALTAAYGQLDEREAAQKSLRELLVLRPNFAATARQELEKWLDPQLAEHFMDGLRKAGLETAHVAMATTPSSGSIADATASGAARGDEGFWVAVLPFKHPDSNTDLRTLAEGLSEEVITGLSRFSYLRVIARGSTAKYSSEAGDVRAIGKEVGARYVMEGSIRQAGATLRISAQLVDAFTGAHLWAESYERAFRTENIFALQDDLVPRIVSTVADAHGVLHRAMTQAVSNKNLEELTPYEALLRTLTYVERLGPEEHAVARACAERAVQLAPNYSQAWAVLAQVYAGEYGHFLNPRPQPLERALKAAQRAVDLDPSNSGAHCALAFVLFFRKQFQAFRIAAEQALELNPYAAGEAVVLGLCIAYSGDWQRGCAVVDRAMQINPRLPGWSRFPAFYNAYRNRDYAGAIRIGLKFNLPNLSSAHAAMAAAYAQVGDLPAAQKELQELHRLMPNTADVLERIRRWHLPEMAGHLIDGLHTAGLEIPEVKKEDPKQTSSGPVPFSQSIAVLPFANMSDDREQDYFSDGLAEEIINLLAQIPALKVIARTSAFAFRGKEQDIRGIAEALGVNTVLEGSVRRSGSRIRVTAQLINATDGSHLWSERYDRELRDIFAVQDEISAAIAKALRVRLTRESATQRYTPKLEAYEAYLKGRYHQAKVTPESMDLARRFYEQASELDPAFAMPHVGLAFYWHCLAHFGRHFARDCVSPARAEARQALQIDPSLPEAHAFLGYIAAMYDLDWAAAETHFDSPGAKEVGFGLLRPLYAWVQFWEGKVEPAIRLAERAIEEDPLEVWTRMNLHAYLQAAGRHDDALEQLKKVLELDENLVLALVSMAMIYADKGNMAEALKIARRAFAIGPWSPDPIGVLAGLTRRNGDEVEASLMKALGSGEMPGDARAHALYHLLCGEIDEGSDWAEKAIVQRDASMMVYLRFVVCRSLRASHRWPTIAKMVNLPA